MCKTGPLNSPQSIHHVRAERFGNGPVREVSLLITFWTFYQTIKSTFFSKKTHSLLFLHFRQCLFQEIIHSSKLPHVMFVFL